ncbi:MAG: hypothetical protein HOI53_09505 [Francisellaceae bacterium]|nr:hypothetical protein [Francisellaceae bacterium]MBT6208249.1 hypothetical protein [Francisellaceae bacterium]MBT6537877.1 hypothetical protein [Francisellaceae bacterium]
MADDEEKISQQLERMEWLHIRELQARVTKLVVDEFKIDFDIASMMVEKTVIPLSGMANILQNQQQLLKKLLITITEQSLHDFYSGAYQELIAKSQSESRFQGLTRVANQALKLTKYCVGNIEAVNNDFVVERSRVRLTTGLSIENTHEKIREIVSYTTKASIGECLIAIDNSMNNLNEQNQRIDSGPRS